MAVKVSWGILALIHLFPALALVRPSLLTALYAIEPQSPAYVLVWHRAALFAMSVLMCVWAIFRPEVRILASIAMAISMLGFLSLFLLNGSPPSLRIIALVDLAGVPFLIFAAWSAFRAA